MPLTVDRGLWPHLFLDAPIVLACLYHGSLIAGLILVTVGIAVVNRPA